MSLGKINKTGEVVLKYHNLIEDLEDFYETLLEDGDYFAANQLEKILYKYK